MDKEESSSAKIRCCCLGRKVIIVVTIFSFLFLVVGIVSKFVIDEIFRNKADENLVLRPESPTYKPWLKSTVPIYAKYFFFNIVNPEEIKKGAKPVVEEIGPYSYISRTQKINITWYHENATVSYDKKTWFNFDEASSCSSCNPFHDNLTTVNIPLMTVAEILKKYPDFFHWKKSVSAFLKQFDEDLFMTRTIHELLWGYEDPLLAGMNKLREEIPILKFFIPHLNSKILLQPNNTFQGQTVIHTGAKNIANLEKWISWKGKDEVDLWLTKYANMINGTDGRQFPPKVTKDKRIYLFVIQSCRSIYITYEQELEYQGITAYRFAIPQKVFENGTFNPENAAFYPNGSFPTGILDVRKCRDGADGILSPVFISAPHFYLADQDLVDGVIGMKPDKAKHQFSFDVEPYLGVILTNDIRLQVNVFIEAVKDITETAHVRKVYMPVMWFQESATVNSDTTTLFRNDIFLPMEICHDLEIAFICIGSLFLCLSGIAVCSVKKSTRRCSFYCYNEEQEPLLSSKKVNND